MSLFSFYKTSSKHKTILENNFECIKNIRHPGFMGELRFCFQRDGVAGMFKYNKKPNPLGTELFAIVLF